MQSSPKLLREPKSSTHHSSPSWGPPDVPPVLGNYHLLYQLASGGMSSVHVARRLKAGPDDRGGAQHFAVKVLSGARRDERGTQYFLSEARVTSGLSHPNVVATVDMGEHEGVPYFVMQLVQGGSLAELIAAYKRTRTEPSPWLAAWIIEQAARGMHAAHELCDASGKPLNLVHRDVSPQNLLLSFDGRVCVSDFGIAKFEDRGVSTAKGIQKGRFAYMSPEHASDEVLDRRADVFSLGVVLYEALTLERLFAGRSAGETLLRLLELRRADPRSARPDVPESLAKIVERCCSKDKAARPQTAADLADALQQAREAAGVGAQSAELAAIVSQHFAPRRRHLERVMGELRAAEAQGRSTVPSVHDMARAAPPPKRGLMLFALALLVLLMAAGLLALMVTR